MTPELARHLAADADFPGASRSPNPIPRRRDRQARAGFESDPPVHGIVGRRRAQQNVTSHQAANRIDQPFGQPDPRLRRSKADVAVTGRASAG